MSYDNIYNIDEGIVEIFCNSLVDDFMDSVDRDIWYNFDNEGDYIEYIREDIIEITFNRGYNNILEEYNKSYTLDFKTSIRLLKLIKEWLVDNYDSEDIFCDMFNDNVDSETKIINQYAYWYIRDNWYNDGNGTDLIIKIFRNIAKYNSHKNKHNKLINLYTKLDKKNKQKKTIIRILNDKFDTDILQNIICAY
jgi:hypothetical protein